MKLLLTARWPVGGIRTYFRYIYTQPAFRNADITLLAPDLELQEFCDNYLAPHGIDYKAAPKDDRALTQAIRAELECNDYDLLHSHGYTSGVLGYRAAKSINIPHLMTVHDVFRSEQFQGFKGKLKWVGLNLIYRRLQGILTVGEDCEANFESYMPWVPRRIIKNIDHGVDVERFASAKARDFRTELNLPETTPLVGFFGRFMAQKGFIDLVHAVKQLSQTLPEERMPRVLTFGWGGFIREDFARVEALGLSQYFIQMPFTDEVPEAIQGVDMVVMPSRWEACGLLAMEVLAAGKPLIATHCQGLRCVVRDSPVHPVPPRDPPALADAIAEQLERGDVDFQDYQPQAIERFGLERPARELFDTYRDVLEKRL